MSNGQAVSRVETAPPAENFCDRKHRLTPPKSFWGRVVLFVDFARPLRPPWHWLNERFLSIGAFAPFLREAGRKQAGQKFYGK